jgi:hypothetical protein
MTGVINMTCGGADIEQNKRVYSKHTRGHGRGRPLGDLARRHLVLALVPRAGVTALAQRQRLCIARRSVRAMHSKAHGRQRCNAELVMRAGGREGGRTTRLPCAAATAAPATSAAARSASSAAAAAASTSYWTSSAAAAAVTSYWTAATAASAGP